MFVSWDGVRVGLPLAPVLLGVLAIGVLSAALLQWGTETVSTPTASVPTAAMEAPCDDGTSTGAESDAAPASPPRPRLIADGGNDPSVDEPESTDSPLEGCNSCGTRLLPDSRFCRSCGVADPFASRPRRASGETDRTAERPDANERGRGPHDDVEPAVATIASELAETTRPSSDEARALLDALADPNVDPETTETALRETIRELDASAAIRGAVDDIEPHDVRHRLDSLANELDGEASGVRRQLAARVRDLETMFDRAGESDVRLYAIYQECTFYDRTLVPRLSRLGTVSDTDVARLRTDIESRCEAVEAEHIAARSDHNHVLPRHFLSLAEELCDEAQRFEEDRPDRAIGILTAADDLLTHVEALYERNEYSVMLRRLRG